MTEIITFGCRLNAFESEVMRAHAEREGLQDTIIINSCAVTQEAERQARQSIRKARRENPNARIVVTGCAAQIAPERFAAMPEVDHVLGNEEKLKQESFTAFAGANAPRIKAGDIMRVKENARHLIPGFSEKARAFLEVQQGCDHRCTFCIIPFGRGNSRSSPIGDIVEQARQFVDQGYKEIVLTGVDITSYGQDLPGRPRLGQLVRRLLQLVPDLRRLRLSSLDVAELDEELMRLIEEEKRLAPHLHLSLQAGSDMILKRMKRRHNRTQAIEISHHLKSIRPGMVLGADLIAGFPTEDQRMFQESLDLVTQCDLTYLHIFPYSARPDTPAARMPQVPSLERKARAQELRKLGHALQQKYFLSRIDSSAEILIEKQEGEFSLGHDQYFAPVRMEGRYPVGDIIEAKIFQADAKGLIAR